MKIRIEYSEDSEATKVIADLTKMYNILNISKVYPNRPPSKSKRIYIDFEIK